jgi:predicted HAD superfamily Cof-like phosphohydrolase
MEGEEGIELELTQYPIEINLVLNQIKSRYLFGNITYSELLNAFCSIANLLLSMLDKLVKLEIVTSDFPGQFLEVHQSNMSKLDKDSKPIFRKDGKILKGENYYKPNLKQFLK